MRRCSSLAAALMLVVVALGLAGITGISGISKLGIAHADLFWCADDPLVQINGARYEITVAVGYSGLGHIVGPVPIAVIVPSTAETRLISFDTLYFTPLVQFFHADQTAAIARFLGVSPDDVVDHAVPWGVVQSNLVRVLAIVHSDAGASFPTRIYVSPGEQLVNGESNHLMQTRFQLRTTPQ